MIEKVDQKIALLLENVSKSFGGVDAIRNVNLAIKYGESCALIGPNGAGKTTLFNLITGEIQADRGLIHLFGHDITNSSVQQRNRLGMGRTYQISNLFLRLTVKENLFLAHWKKRHKRSLPILRSWSRYTIECDQAREVARIVGLEGRLETLAENLSHGEQRQLEIGIAIVSNPRIVLLDEPTAGLSPTERIFITKLIADLTLKTTVLLIEHNMSTVFSIVKRIIVMNKGSVIADGSPENIHSNKQVQQIYMIDLEAKSGG